MIFKISYLRLGLLCGCVGIGLFGVLIFYVGFIADFLPKPIGLWAGSLLMLTLIAATVLSVMVGLLGRLEVICEPKRFSKIWRIGGWVIHRFDYETKNVWIKKSKGHENDSNNIRLMATVGGEDVVILNVLEVWLFGLEDRVGGMMALLLD